MKRFLILIALVTAVLLTASCSSETVKDKPDTTSEEKISLAPLFTKHTETGPIPYWFYIPEEAEENMPLIVVLHCSYTKAEDSLSAEENLDKLTDETQKDITSYIYNGEFGKVPAYILMPQISSDSRGWAKRGEDLITMINSLMSEYPIDPERISIIGYSMGGTGVLEISSAYPNIFNKVMVISGGLDGVTNNNIPYVKGEGRMTLNDGFFPELIIQGSTEKMKYAYAPEGNSALATTPEEKKAAADFESYRISDTAEKLKNSTSELWLMIGENDTDVSPTVIRGISSQLDAVRCDIISECGHSGVLGAVLEKNKEITEFLIS